MEKIDFMLAISFPDDLQTRLKIGAAPVSFLR
jgi:hypothetical protein